MKKYTLLLLSLVLIGCSNDAEDAVENIIIEGRYLHEIPDCDNSNNPEINCIEFVDFRDENSVDVLIGGGDIVAQATYVRNGKNITIQQGEGTNFGISFEIISETELMRLEDQSIWAKE